MGVLAWKLEPRISGREFGDLVVVHEGMGLLGFLIWGFRVQSTDP